MSRQDRPTVAPPFDPTEYARESEAKLKVAKPARRQSVQPAPTSAVVACSPSRSLALTDVPIVTLTFQELVTMQLDHRAGFLLSLIDGHSTVEAVLDMCGMPHD